MHVQNITLELSGKPLIDESVATMREVCRRLFTQWKPLTDAADGVSVMLWIADGSEILEYTGDLARTFEWAYWCGVANACPFPGTPTERERRHTHYFPVKYRPDAGPRTYAWLKRLVEVIRETGAAIAGKPIRIGATYDNGPEFAVSAFKFRKHREIAQGHSLYPNSFVTCTARLHADPQPYAAFPQGIPEGTSIGTFLGAQFKVYARDLGFDYLWLSNGMGFGTETWGITGMLFDKQAFHPEKAEEAARLMLDFWRDFHAAHPDCVIETRGSNFSAGVEIATDACPLRELYRDFKIAPPVNSPWAALNFNTGLEIVAWMSHIAELPDDRIPFRFYTHDPWFLNSPWLDRYGREPWDLYQPLSIGRVDGDGHVAMANRIALLSVDDTWGRLPDQVPREVIPRLFDAFDTGPDQPGPLVWVYPFDEYSTRVRGDDPRPDVVFLEDMFIGECVQEGLPLNTVVSTGNFRALIASGSRALDASVLVVPVSACGDANLAAVETFLDRGGRVLFYGALQGAPERLRALLQLEAGAPITGEVAIRNDADADVCEEGPWPTKAHVLPQYACGGLVETLADGADAEAHAFAEQAGSRRVLALTRTPPAGGAVGFVRAVLPSAAAADGGRHFNYGDARDICATPRLMRHLLARFGWTFKFQAFERGAKLPRTTLARHDNAFFFTVYAPDTTVAMAVASPFGAPIPSEMETRIDAAGNAVWHPGKCLRRECRCFAKQAAPAVIHAKIEHQAYPRYSDVGWRNYHGFQDAEVRFFPPTGFKDKLEIVHSPTRCDGAALSRPTVEPRWEETPAGPCAVLEHVTGHLYFAW